jgi:hypoxanthine phosphoribosyltransferase
MIQWAALKAFSKKAYLWIKTYWYVPIGALWAIATWFFFRQKATLMVDNFKETRKAHKKEVDIINKSKEEEVKTIKEKVDAHLIRTKEAEERYATASATTSKKVKERAEELRKKDNDVLADELRKIIGGGNK